MKRELLYYKLLSVVYNLLPNGYIKDKFEEYANARFPIASGHNEKV